VADIRGTVAQGLERLEGQAARRPVPLTPCVRWADEAPDPDAEVEARKRDALVMIALYALPHEAHKPPVGHAGRGLFHAPRRRRHRLAYAPPVAPRRAPTSRIVRARRSPVGEGLQVLVYTRDQPDLFARICGYFDQAGFSILDAKVHTAATVMRWTPSRS
jgi:[protein-PII] uridylyltransferase